MKTKAIIRLRTWEGSKYQDKIFKPETFKELKETLEGERASEIEINVTFTRKDIPSLVDFLMEAESKMLLY